MSARFEVSFRRAGIHQERRAYIRKVGENDLYWIPTKVAWAQSLIARGSAVEVPFHAGASPAV
jgi:hypothetical protein